MVKQLVAWTHPFESLFRWLRGLPSCSDGRGIKRDDVSGKACGVVAVGVLDTSGRLGFPSGFDVFVSPRQLLGQSGRISLFLRRLRVQVRMALFQIGLPAFAHLFQRCPEGQIEGAIVAGKFLVVRQAAVRRRRIGRWGTAIRGVRAI